MLLGVIVAELVALGEAFVGLEVGVIVSMGVGVTLWEAVAVKTLLGEIVGVFAEVGTVSVGVLVNGVVPTGAGVLVIVSTAVGDVLVGVMPGEGDVSLGVNVEE